MKKKLTINGKNYWLYKYPTESKSKYNTMVCVKQFGDKMPIWGTTCKESDKLEDFEHSATKAVSEYENGVYSL